MRLLVMSLLIGTLSACSSDDPAAPADTIAPAAPVITSPATGLTVRENNPSVQGTAETGSTVELFDSDGTTLGTAVSSGSSWTITSSTLADGAHSLTAKATDAAGNTGVASTAVTLTVDTIAPAAPTISSPADGTATNDTTPLASGTAEDGSTVELLNGTTSLGTAVASGGTWEITSSALTDGTYNLTARATDAVGNTGVASTIVVLTVDTVVPDLDTESPLDTTTDVLTNTTVTMSFSEAMDGTTLTTSTFTLTAGSAVAGDVTYDEGSLTAEFTPTAALSPDTSYTAEITSGATDAAGNALSAGLTWTFNTEEFILRGTVNANGVESNGDSNGVTISADGRFVGFYTGASNLVAGDTNATDDTFIHDFQTGTTTVVSIGFDGSPADDASDDQPAISADGRWVAFWSGATNLVANDANGEDDIFLRDTVNGTTSLVSVDSNDVQSNGYSSSMAMSADGRYVAFRSRATNLVASDTNGVADIFLRDTVNGTTTRVNVTSGGVEATVGSDSPAISPDGGHVAWVSADTNLVAGDTNGVRDVFLHDVATGATTRISVAIGGAEPNARSDYPSISADGRYVSFESSATNLVAGDTNASPDIFVHDTQSGTTTRVTLSTAGVEGNSSSSCYNLAISADGRYVAFTSDADNLVTGDSGSTSDIFVRDTVLDTTIRVSVNAAGEEGDGDVHSAMLSDDGRYVGFISDTTNLIPNDNNNLGDILRVLNAVP